MARRHRQFQQSNSVNNNHNTFVSGSWRNNRQQNRNTYSNFEDFAADEANVSSGEAASENSSSFRLSHLFVLILTGLLFISNTIAWRVVGYSLAWMLLAGAFFTSVLLALAISWRLIKRGYRKLLAVFLSFAIAPTAYLGANVFSVVYDPTINTALETKMPAKPQFVFYTRSGGGKLTSVFDESERFVSPDELWESHLSRAIMYLEDERLMTRYTGPLDPEAIIRAIKENLKNFEIVEGGSGIEIQTGKLITGFKTEGFLDKGTQALIAFRLDQLFPSPQEKLCLYGNIAFLIGDKRGVGYAAADLFGVSDLRNLTPDQAAVIAAMLKNPRIFDPRRNPQKVIERRNIALDNMFKQNALSKAEFDKAKAAELKVLPRFKSRELFVRAAIELHELGKFQKTEKEQKQ